MAGTGLLFSKYLKATHVFRFTSEGEMSKDDFGPGFKWGVASSSYQTEGACVTDKLEFRRVHDMGRINYFKNHLAAVLKAKREGVNVNGYFVWSPTDNFEWDKGFRTRFGLVYIDFQTLA